MVFRGLFFALLISVIVSITAFTINYYGKWEGGSRNSNVHEDIIQNIDSLGNIVEKEHSQRLDLTKNYSEIKRKQIEQQEKINRQIRLRNLNTLRLLSSGNPSKDHYLNPFADSLICGCVFFVFSIIFSVPLFMILEKIIIPKIKKRTP